VAARIARHQHAGTLDDHLAVAHCAVVRTPPRAGARPRTILAAVLEDVPVIAGQDNRPPRGSGPVQQLRQSADVLGPPGRVDRLAALHQRVVDGVEDDGDNGRPVGSQCLLQLRAEIGPLASGDTGFVHEDRSAARPEPMGTEGGSLDLGIARPQSCAEQAGPAERGLGRECGEDCLAGSGAAPHDLGPPRPAVRDRVG
jgi:hypothetical protein